MISNNPTCFCQMSSFPTLDSLLISLLPWYDATCSQHQPLPPIHSCLRHCSMSRTTAGLHYHGIEPTHPPILQATGLLTSVCANSNNQVHLPVYLLSLFTCLINTKTFLPYPFAAVCFWLTITRVCVSRALVQYSHSAAGCVIQFLMWVRHGDVADWHVQSVNPVPWGPLQDLHCHCNIHKWSVCHVVFILSLCFGVFLSPHFYSLYPLEVQHFFLIICNFCSSFQFCLFFFLAS
jgi:hypothetical protein